MRYYAFRASKGSTLNINKIQEEFFRTTGAIHYPQPFFDEVHFLSAINFIRKNEVLPVVFINENKKRGFYFYAASDKLAVFIEFESTKPLKNNELPQAFNVTWFSADKFHKVVIGVLTLSPLILLLTLIIPSRIKTYCWRRIDSIRSYGVNAAFSVIVLPAAVLFAFWRFGFQTEGFAVAMAAVLLVFMIIIRSIYRYLSKPIVLLRLDNLPRFLITSYERRSTTIIMDVPDTSYSQHLTVWVAHSQECKRCNSQYAIYTPSREAKDTGEGKRDLSKSEASSMLESAMKETLPPINGCPKCHSNRHVSQEAINKYNKKTKEDNWYAVGFLVAGGLGTYLVHYLTSNEIVKSGVLLDSMKAISSGLPFTLQDSYIIGGSVILSTLYASYRLFSHKRGYGLWVCSKDGYIFENINPSADLEKSCPSCKNEMIPIKDIKIR